jgi:hypothetical protein
MIAGNEGSVILRNLVVKPGHDQLFLDAWQYHTSANRRNGEHVVDAFFETGPGVTFDLASGERGTTGESRIFTWLSRSAADGASTDAIAELQDHVIEDSGPRQVEPEILTEPATETFSMMTVMRRYQIQGDWDEFLDLWRQIAVVRERHGFHILFAVGDRQHRTFTWGFTTDDDDFEHFMSLSQKGYYEDRQRIELETINAYLKTIALTPSHRIALS